MKLNYYPETDSLYIDLSSKPSKENLEVSEGVVTDYDEDGRITGINVDNATHKINLKEIIMNRMPAQLQSIYSVSIYLYKI